MMANQQRITQLIGWILFLISSSVYLFTLEPTVSFWDCGEFITCAAGLQNPHPPGAPLFTLLGRLFAMLSFGNSEKVAVMVNSLSAISSGLTIMFMFWSIIIHLKPLRILKSAKPEFLLKAIVASAASLSFAFTDSFWFSAVETEVYALSSFLVALIIYLAIRMQSENDHSLKLRFLFLIIYILGLSIGIHLLNLLVVPAIILMYYFSIHAFHFKKFVVIAILSFLLVYMFMEILIPFLPKLIAYTDLILVNSFHVKPYGAYIIVPILLAAIMMLLLRFSIKQKKQFIYNMVLAFSFLALGFSSYGVSIIRSMDNPFIDMNNVENPFSLINYLNREQYGNRPIFYGQNFNSPVVGTSDKFSYELVDGHYEKYPLHNPKVKYAESTLQLFPRMYSDSPEHIEAYKDWSNFRGRKVQFRAPNGEQKIILIPTLVENIRFFVRYQFGHMYLRYFMWNFAGRQNDIQGTGEILYGNWISGFSFIDRARLGNEKLLPDYYTENPARNTYYLIPLILGILGAVYQYKKSKKDFWITCLLFLSMGVAIVFYLNEVPRTPRERDYVYVGSFFMYAFWMAYGMLSVVQLISQDIKRFPKLIYGIAITCFFVPLFLFLQNFDDHNRSGRFHVIKYAKNYLNSCARNAILFTTADNDTYSLWYAREVEKVRTDLQVVLKPYLISNWYFEHIMHTHSTSPKIEMSCTKNQFKNGKNTFVPVIPKIKESMELAEVLKFVRSENKQTKVQLADGSWINYIPGKHVHITHPETGERIRFGFNLNYISRDDLIVFDIISRNIFHRDIYFSNPQFASKYECTGNLGLEGYAYKLSFDSKRPENYFEIGHMNTNRLYQKYMQEFSYDDWNDNSIYHDWTHRRNILNTQLRNRFARLAKQLIEEGQAHKAKEVLDKIVDLTPFYKIPPDFHMIEIAALYAQLQENERAEKLLNDMFYVKTQLMDYYATLENWQKHSIRNKMELDRYELQRIQEVKRLYEIN